MTSSTRAAVWSDLNHTGSPHRKPPLRDALAPQAPDGGSFQSLSKAVKVEGGESNSKLSTFSWTKPINWKAEKQFLQEGSRTEKKTRASLPQLLQNKIMFSIQGPPLGSSTLLFSSYSKGLSSWVNITGISQMLIPILPSPLKCLCPAHFHLSKSYPWKPSSNHCSPWIHPWLPRQEAVTLLWNSKRTTS